MSDNEYEEDKPTPAQLEAAFPGRTFIDGGVSENQLAAAYPEVADAEGDGVSIPEDELKDLSAHKPRRALPLSKQLMILLSMGYDPESAAGRVSLLGGPLPELSDVFLARDLEKEDAVRLNVYQRLTEQKDYRIADSFPSNLGVSGSVSVNTVGSIDDRLEDTPAADHIDIELRRVARAFEETPLDDVLLTLPKETADGTGPPLDTQLTRQVKKTGYACVQLGRVDDWEKYEKWELFKPYELAAKDNIHANDAHKNLNAISRYWEADSPDDKALWNQIRECSRSQIRRMFLAAYDQFIELALRNGHIPENPEVAIDITGWPWFSIENDPLGTQSEKPNRNYDKSWQFATISLVNVDLPFTIGVREIASRKNKQYNIQHLLDLTESKFDIKRVYVDRGFYSSAVRDEFVSRDLDFVMMARRNMGRFYDLVDGACWNDWEINHAPYQISTQNEDDYEDWLVARFSEKRSNLRKSSSNTGIPDPYCDWEAYYTNIDPSEYDGGLEQLTDDYRLRWGIETSYRLLKNKFLLKASTDMWEKRTFLFCLAVLYYNMWLASNSLKASTSDEPVKDDQGRYQMTAHRFMMSLLNDFGSVSIGEVDDLSEKSEMVEAVFEDAG
jgi:hypothetical protein